MGYILTFALGAIIGATMVCLWACLAADAKSREDEE